MHRRGAANDPVAEEGAAVSTEIANSVTDDIHRRVQSMDWDDLRVQLDEVGHAITPVLLNADECVQLASLFDDGNFRSTIDMARHRFGDGRYRYFAHPLPEMIAALRAAFYPPLAVVANRWSELLRGEYLVFATTHDELLEQCQAAGQTRPTPLILRYGEGDWNALHQDLYGDVYFPFQVLTVLSERGVDYEGGEFVLLEKRRRSDPEPLSALRVATSSARPCQPPCPGELTACEAHPHPSSARPHFRHSSPVYVSMSQDSPSHQRCLQRLLNMNATILTGCEAVREQFVLRAEAEGLIDVAVEQHDSPLGRLTLAVTADGVVRIGLANETYDDVLYDVAARISPRVIRTSRGVVSTLRRELDEYFAGARKTFDVAIDWRLTKGFRRKILRAAACIPYGETASYGQVAADAGSARAVRATGSALANNALPILVPCHRVRPASGGMGDYRGGRDAKAFLLDLERAR